MTEEMQLKCFELISMAGDARSCFIEAIQSAGEGDEAETEKLMAQGHAAFAKGHNIHLDMLGAEADGEQISGLLLIHAEDQMMSAESFGVIAEQFIDLYRKLREQK